mmetsp:Transcript_139397/g.347583  ORF Transcript_139397/g.347583 Transcript_139397/m.347583 type:complete len:240 (+) Transcript_139397:315-1034(+)
MLEESLNDSASIDVQRHDFCSGFHSVDNESHEVWRHLLDAFLDYVVAMHALHTIDYSSAQLRSEPHLHLGRAYLESCLDDSATIHLVCQLEYLSLELLCCNSALVHCGCLKQCLDYLRAIAIDCEGCKLRHQGLKYDLAHRVLNRSPQQSKKHFRAIGISRLVCGLRYDVGKRGHRLLALALHRVAGLCVCNDPRLRCSKLWNVTIRLSTNPGPAAPTTSPPWLCLDTAIHIAFAAPAL